MAYATASPRTIDAVSDMAARAHEKPAISPLAHSIPVTAHLLSIGESKTWALIREGKIRSIKLGRRTLVPVHEIERLLQTGC
jgi:excisionase family DNA binding protein